jgi:SIR2-like domain
MARSKSRFDHVVFIIGAGHSLSANAPSTEELTSWIIDGTGPISLSQWTPGKIDLLKRVRAHLETSGLKPTYESIFTWLWTAYFSSDPTMYRAAWDSTDSFKKVRLVRSLLVEQLAYEALRCIEEGVQQALSDERLEPGNAPVLTLQVADDASVNHLTLITLNHDRVLERVFETRPGYCDGFKPSVNSYPSWSAERPETRQWEQRIQLIKLHGSIDWWSPRPWNDGSVVYRHETRPTEKKCVEPPMFLVGTGPKLFQSSNLMFARQILDAGHALSCATCVIVVGYSFGDVRTNSLWSGATEQSLANECPLPALIIDPAPNRLRDDVRATKRSKSLVGLLENQKIVAYKESEAAAVKWSDCKTLIEELAP